MNTYIEETLKVVYNAENLGDHILDHRNLRDLMEKRSERLEI